MPRRVSKLAPRREEIVLLLSARVSKRAIARLMGCSPGTLYKYLRDANITVAQKGAAT